jgi:hypothetical protein
VTIVLTKGVKTQIRGCAQPPMFGQCRYRYRCSQIGYEAASNLRHDLISKHPFRGVFVSTPISFALEIIFLSFFSYSSRRYFVVNRQLHVLYIVLHFPLDVPLEFRR